MKHFFVSISIFLFIFASLGIRPAYAAGPSSYEVQPGDTLSAVAARYGVSVDELARANNLNPNGWLYSGQQLIIPNFTPFPAPPAFTGTFNQSTNFESSAAPYGNYTIQPGDTLYGIAQRYGVAIVDLQAANGLSDPNLPIYAGQQLFIPYGINATVNDSLLTRPALADPSQWNNYSQWASQPLYSSQSPGFYQSAPAQLPTAWNSNGQSERWIDVDLTRQVLTAYEGQAAVFSSLVSSGVWQYPTVVGAFQVYLKYEMADMSGGSGEDAYYLPNVPYIMYFYRNYSLHGTYWHNNFGRPMSHGCINLPTPAAEWLFNWAPLGLKVVTHY